MTNLYRAVALSDNHTPGTCWAWMESAERVCGKPEGDEAAHLCGAHVTVARRRAAKNREKAAAERSRQDAVALSLLPGRRARLAAVDAEIARRDPAPPTTDMAAYGGLGSTAATGYQRRLLSDTNVARLAELWAERGRLAADVAHAELILMESS